MPRRDLPLSAYPVTLQTSAAFDHWLDTLPKLSNRRMPIDPTILKCDCCGQQEQSLNNTVWYPINRRLLLPCGCKCLHWCLERCLGPETRGESCPACDVRLLRWEKKQSTTERWLNGMEVVDVKTIDEEDRFCGICHEDFGHGDAVGIEQREDEAIDMTQEGENGKDEVSEIDEEEGQECPIRLKPCNHIFGNRCLKTWLTPGPEGGNSNSCPACRQILFLRETVEDEGDWEGDGWLTVHQGFS